MKKAERKILKKAIKENIKANLVLVLKQTTTDLGSVDAKFEKQILKGSDKLAKKLAKLIRPVEPLAKVIKPSVTATSAVANKIAPVKVAIKKASPTVTIEPAK
jgi:hypothetical protein